MYDTVRSNMTFINLPLYLLNLCVSDYSLYTEKSTNQNSGVRFDATTKRGKDTYYGYIVDIWELGYRHDFKVPLYKCKWVNLSGDGVQVDNSGSEQSLVPRRTIRPSQ